jgi:uncharacterized membrane protein YfcA
MILTAVILGAGIGLCLGALGGGGSIITVPALIYLLDQPLSTAVTQSLVIVGISSATAMLAHATARRVRWGTGIILGGIGAAASLAGTALGRLIPADTAMIGFACLMIVVAAVLTVRTRTSARDRHQTRDRMLVTSGAPSDGDSPRPDPITSTIAVTTAHRLKTAAAIILTGILVGVLTGFFGVGGGFVIAPALVLILRYPMPIAVGTSLLVITLNSAAALTARVSQEALDWSIIAPVATAAIVGSVAGKYATQKISDKTLTRMFATMLIVVAIYVGARSLTLVPH